MSVHITKPKGPEKMTTLSRGFGNLHQLLTDHFYELSSVIRSLTQRPRNGASPGSISMSRVYDKMAHQHGVYLDQSSRTATTKAIDCLTLRPDMQEFIIRRKRSVQTSSVEFISPGLKGPALGEQFISALTLYRSTLDI